MRMFVVGVSVLWLLLQFPAAARSSPPIRIAYINSYNNNNSIPQAFLERAKRNNYTHVIVEFYITEPTDWVNGNYNHGNYSGGKLFNFFNDIVAKVQANGLKIIPFIHVPGTATGTSGGVHSWYGALYRGIECYRSDTLIPCIASGLKAGSVVLDSSFQHVFKETIRVLHAAYVKHSGDALEYICLGYSECYDPHNKRVVWGTGKKGGGVSIDQKWMLKNGKDTTDLALASINQRVVDIRTCVAPRDSSKFSATTVMVLGDMFSKTTQESVERRNVGTTTFPSKVSTVVDFTDKVIVMPWWYSKNTWGDIRDFKTDSLFRDFTDKNHAIRLIYWSCITAIEKGYTESELCLSFVPQLFEYIATAPNFPDNIVGYVAAHWDGTGYDNDLCWNTMEYLAYGNQVARPQSHFSPLPRGTIDNATINPLLCSRTEITQGDYLAVTGRHPFYVDGRGQLNTGSLDYPAEEVTFYDAIIYCNERSVKEGLAPVFSYGSPVYHGENCMVLDSLRADTSMNGYRLPSPEEWRYAYRAGTKTAYYWGGEKMHPYCWGNFNSATTQPVGKKLPNAWNIHDIAGNVEEWACSYKSPERLTTGYAGGSFTADAADDQFRNNGYMPASNNSVHHRWLGFRVVRKAPATMPADN